MAKNRPAGKRFNAKMVVQAVVSVPIIADNFDDALAAAKAIKVSETIDPAEGNELVDYTGHLQGVENGRWIDYE